MTYEEYASELDAFIYDTFILDSDKFFPLENETEAEWEARLMDAARDIIQINPILEGSDISDYLEFFSDCKPFIEGALCEYGYSEITLLQALKDPSFLELVLANYILDQIIDEILDRVRIEYVELCS